MRSTPPGCGAAEADWRALRFDAPYHEPMTYASANRYGDHRRRVLMPELPRGTVTFLFTDIEGSTGLWQGHPGAKARVYGRHDAMLREHGLWGEQWRRGEPGA